MKINVALDLRHRSDGAVKFAKWLRGNSQSGALELIATHVIDEELVASLRDVRTYDNLVFYAQDGLKKMLAEVRAENLFSTVKIEDGGEIIGKLESVCTQQSADAMVIGRVAPTDKDVLLRLGAVARGLLRRLVVPIIVVPPDFEESFGGQGPVIVAVDGKDTSLAAYEFGKQVAASLNRELVLVHAVGIPDSWGYGYVSTDAVQTAMTAMRVGGERTIERWCSQHGISGIRSVVAQGVTSREIVRVAEELDAAMIVTGSRQLSKLERFFVTSVGTEVAASSPIPVAVVAAPHEDS